jgi:RNA polymerase sigma-70 factor (TIGR02960 family)
MAAMPTTEADFAALAERHRRELHIHCYRMLGNFEEAEDLVQETLLRAWRRRETLEREEWMRAWLYKIATNACLDHIKAKGRRVATVESFRDLPWLQPYPDRLLDEGPDAAVVARETIELTFLAVIQLLPPRQRAVLILREVLEWTAEQVAELLELSVAAVNSALQRARATLRDRLPAGRREEWAGAEISASERELLDGFIDAHERGDTELALSLITDDVRVTMPPNPFLFEGRHAIAELLEQAFGPQRPGDWRLVPTRANRQPAAASYLRAIGDDTYRAFKLDVIRARGDRIAEITTFDATLFPAFGLPPVHPGDQRP